MIHPQLDDVVLYAKLLASALNVLNNAKPILSFITKWLKRRKKKG